MAVPGRQMHVRLPQPIASKFDALCDQFSGLQPGTVLRLLIASQLERPLEAQVQAVTEQIIKPKSRPRTRSASSNSRSRLGE